MEVSTLVTILILVVLLFVVLGGMYVLLSDTNVFRGEGNICELTRGLIRGCT